MDLLHQTKCCFLPQFPCAPGGSCGLCWHGAVGMHCKNPLSLEELLALGMGEGMAAWETWGTNRIGRSPQGWGDLSRSIQTLLEIRLLIFMVIKSQPKHGGGSDPLPALQHRACVAPACPGFAEQVITQTVPCSDEVINDPIICAL